jgi:predicted transcriptional regulator
MHTTNELFAKMPAASAAQIFTHIGEKEKNLLKATVDTLASQRKLRPIFVERKPKNERFAWLQEALSRKQNENIAAQLLQIWLVGAHSKLLCDFLDGFGIAHDDHGTIEELPPAPEKAKVAEVVSGLLEKHDPATVAIYLHAFQATDENGGWNTLEEVLAEDSRLKLG